MFAAYPDRGRLIATMSGGIQAALRSARRRADARWCAEVTYAGFAGSMVFTSPYILNKALPRRDHYRQSRPWEPSVLQHCDATRPPGTPGIRVAFDRHQGNAMHSIVVSGAPSASVRAIRFSLPDT